jgi:hypothetical protein
MRTQAMSLSCGMREISKSCGRRGVEKRHPEGDKKHCCHHTMAAQPQDTYGTKECN